MKRWYVVQVFAGYEDRVKKDFLKVIAEKGLEDLFGEILIPSVKLKKFFTSEQAEDQQLFPGYILVQMDLASEAIKLVTSTPRVIKFLGGKEPVALTPKEVEKIRAKIEGEVVVTPREKIFTEGTEVEITDGPFAGFFGVIENIDEQAERLTVMVRIFERMTPVELRFDQVKG